MRRLRRGAGITIFDRDRLLLGRSSVSVLSLVSFVAAIAILIALVVLAIAGRGGGGGGEGGEGVGVEDGVLHSRCRNRRREHREPNNVLSASMGTASKGTTTTVTGSYEPTHPATATPMGQSPSSPLSSAAGGGGGGGGRAEAGEGSIWDFTDDDGNCTLGSVTTSLDDDNGSYGNGEFSLAPFLGGGGRE